MPELPEVERGRKIAAEVAGGRRIVGVRCADDPVVFDDVAPSTVRRTLVGKTVVEACRHGKQLWLQLDEPPHPLFHFGMTGAFVTPGVDDAQLASGPTPHRGQTWPPRFWKIVLEVEGGRRLAMTNARRLGRIRLRRDPRHEPPISLLGFDPLVNMPSPKTFLGLVARRRGTLKGLLLDQSFAAGVGNWVADEVLYQARLDPRRTVTSLSQPEVRTLRTKLAHVVKTAVAVDADSDRFPRGWLFHRRWRRVEGASIGGDAIAFDTVAGRTTAWVPARQR